MPRASNDGSLTPIDPLTGKPARRSASTIRTIVLDAGRQIGHRRRRGGHRLDFRDPHTMTHGVRCIARRNAAASTTPTSRSTARYAFFTCEFTGSIAEDRHGRAEGAKPATSCCRSRTGAEESRDPRRRPGHRDLHLEARACRRTSAPRPTARALRGRHGGRRRPRGRRRPVQGNRLHRHRRRRARPVPEPRRQEALHRQPRLAPHPRAAHTARAACRCSTSPPTRSSPTGRFPAAAAPTWATSRADGKYLWLSGRYDDVVYRFDTASGAVRQDRGRPASRTA